LVSGGASTLMGMQTLRREKFGQTYAEMVILIVRSLAIT
jgi:hypothetical protein